MAGLVNGAGGPPPAPIAAAGAPGGGGGGAAAGSGGGGSGGSARGQYTPSQLLQKLLKALGDAQQQRMSSAATSRQRAIDFFQILNIGDITGSNDTMQHRLLRGPMHDAVKASAHQAIRSALTPQQQQSAIHQHMQTYNHYAAAVPHYQQQLKAAHAQMNGYPVGSKEHQTSQGYIFTLQQRIAEATNLARRARDAIEQIKLAGTGTAPAGSDVAGSAGYPPHSMAGQTAAGGHPPPSAGAAAAAAARTKRKAVNETAEAEDPQTVRLTVESYTNIDPEVIHQKALSVAAREGVTGPTGSRSGTAIHPRVKELLTLAVQQHMRNVVCQLIKISQRRVDLQRELLGKEKQRMVSYPKLALDRIERAARDEQNVKDQRAKEIALKEAQAAQEKATRQRQTNIDKEDGMI